MTKTLYPKQITRKNSTRIRKGGTRKGGTRTRKGKNKKDELENIVHSKKKCIIIQN